MNWFAGAVVAMILLIALLVCVAVFALLFWLAVTEFSDWLKHHNGNS